MSASSASSFCYLVLTALLLEAATSTTSPGLVSPSGSAPSAKRRGTGRPSSATRCCRRSPAILLANRAIWLGVSLPDAGAGLSAVPLPDARRRDAGERRGAEAKRRVAAPAARPLPTPRFDAPRARAQLWAWTRFEMAQVFRSPAYLRAARARPC